MRVIVYAHKNSGVSFHRLICPFLCMEDTDVLITNDFQESHYTKGCDIVVYNRVLPTLAMAQIKAQQAIYGFKICVDIDDYWELDPHHVLYKEYQNIDFASQQIHHLKEADVVLTTHERLAEKVRPINPNVHICPNAIPPQGQFDIERTESKLMRLFWQGSDTHKHDIGILKTAIHSLGSLSPKIKMVMSGYVQNNAEWDRMARDYTAELKHQYKLIAYAPVTSYYEAYKHADVCLVPLVNSPFNSMKSNLKILEAANLALPVIASKVNPYLNMPVLYASNSGDWVTNIILLERSKSYREDVGYRLKEFADEIFCFAKINAERKQILEYVSKKEKV